MAFGALAHIGLGKESTFGTPVAAVDYLRFASEGINEEIEQIVSEQLNGTIDEGPSYEGLHNISGDISFDVYPNVIGHILRSAFGPPTTSQPDASSNPTVYQHVFTPTQVNFSSLCAVASYTLEIHRDLEQAFQYAGAVVNELTLNFGTDDKIMKASASIIAKSLALIAKTTPNFETTDPFLWHQAVVKINDTVTSDLQTVEFGVNNSLEGSATLDGTKTISRIYRTGRRTFPVSMTFDVKNLDEFNRFRSQTEVPVTIELTGANISGTYNYKMTVEFPKLRYTAFPINVGGAETLTAQVDGTAKYDPAKAYAAKITLINTKQSY
jgi:hypothetical protein